MKCQWQWGVTAVLAATLVAPVAAQESQGTVPPAGTLELTVTLDDVTILRAVNGLHLTAAQMSPLVQRLEASVARIRQAGQGDAAAWTAATRALRQAIPQASSGAPTGAADAELARVQQLARGKQDAAQEQSRTEVRALLEQNLTPAQKAALLKMGRDEMVQRRLARLETDDLNRIERMGRELDRLREASPQEYTQARQRFAMQMANLPGWWDVGRQNGTGSAGAPGGQGGNRAARGGNGGGQGGNRGDGLVTEQRRLRLQQQRQDAQAQLADPARRAQMRQFQMLADQVRALPQQTYAQRRTQLAAQLYQSQSQTLAQTAAPDEAMDAFIDRYLLVSRAPVVLAERLQAMG
jgi:hypothetical protein